MARAGVAPKIVMKIDAWTLLTMFLVILVSSGRYHSNCHNTIVESKEDRIFHMSPITAGLCNLLIYCIVYCIHNLDSSIAHVGACCTDGGGMHS